MKGQSSEALSGSCHRIRRTLGHAQRQASTTAQTATTTAQTIDVGAYLSGCRDLITSSTKPRPRLHWRGGPFCPLPEQLCRFGTRTNFSADRHAFSEVMGPTVIYRNSDLSGCPCPALYYPSHHHSKTLQPFSIASSAKAVNRKSYVLWYAHAAQFRSCFFFRHELWFCCVH